VSVQFNLYIPAIVPGLGTLKNGAGQSLPSQRLVGQTENSLNIPSAGFLKAVVFVRIKEGKS
jgi:hypothetical protein